MGEQKQIKLLIFQDDNDIKKDKHVLIHSENSFGITVQFYNVPDKETHGPIFFLPWHRVLKIKDLKEDTNV